MIRWLFIFFLIVFSHPAHAQPLKAQAAHVVLISFDGLRPDAITELGEDKAPAFYQMMREGAFTLNARTDHDLTVTLPNHACMITGYPVKGDYGHHLTENVLMPDKTIHDFAGRHIDSIFDTLRKNNAHSAMLSSKLKFNIYQNSFPIDTVALTDYDDIQTLENFIKLTRTGLPDFVFLHFAGADRVGHKEGWIVSSDSSYMAQVETLDDYLKLALRAIQLKDELKDSTVVIVTADHGGEGMSHSDPKNPLDYTVPFIIWGKAVAKGADLYKINADRRRDPLEQRIPYDQKDQPIRNGDAANVALSVLGLPSVEGSTIGNEKPLKIHGGNN
ncbi:MAG: alkaline phosphatase family protein [Candidatus Omnitrophica bacterium]|nr:alkaline phosphatase family protein [Candidatus Omnitrophota bacterium]